MQEAVARAQRSPAAIRAHAGHPWRLTAQRPRRNRPYNRQNGLAHTSSPGRRSTTNNTTQPCHQCQPGGKPHTLPPQTSRNRRIHEPLFAFSLPDSDRHVSRCWRGHGSLEAHWAPLLLYISTTNLRWVRGSAEVARRTGSTTTGLISSCMPIFLSFWVSLAGPCELIALLPQSSLCRMPVIE